MGAISLPQPVQLIAGLLYSQGCVQFDGVMRALQKRCGICCHAGDPFLFDCTHYYDDELGQPVMRQYISFDQLIDPGSLAEIKVLTNEIESGFSCNGNRTVNVDPGYITLSSLVLASTKEASYRVYIGKGIYAQTMLQYMQKTYVPLPWTYTDYKMEQSIAFFNMVRQRYHAQL